MWTESTTELTVSVTVCADAVPKWRGSTQKTILTRNQSGSTLFVRLIVHMLLTSLIIVLRPRR